MLVLSDHHDVENTVAEMGDELFRLADHLELGGLEEANSSYEQLREKFEALRVYITNQMNQQEKEST